MPLVAIRVNRVVGAPDPAWTKDGDPINEDDWEFDDANESCIYVDTTDIWDIENGMSDVKDILYGWTAEDKKPEPEATKT